jgi:predicted acyltransferase
MTTRERLVALDVFRGLTVAGMLLVNNPGSWSAIYPPLAHATWHGWTPTDLIFPFFLFIVGITTHLSLDARRARGDAPSVLVRQVLRRGALIVLCGLFLSWFPGFTYARTDALADATLLDRVVHRLEHLRLPGVLQRIGLAYIAGGLLVLRLRWRQQIVAAALILLGYWALMTIVPVPGTGGQLGAALLDDPSQVLSAWLDRTLLGEAHLWSGSRTWDPEGLLSTLPAVGTVLLGALTGAWLGQKARPIGDRLSAMFAVGSLLMVLGSMWGWVFPINKGLWTSSYVVFTGGMAAVALATCLWLIDVQRVRWWTQPFVVYGTNPLVAFLGSGIMARLIGGMITWESDGRRVSLQQVVYESAFASWAAPRVASLLFALAFVLVWYLILLVLHRRGIVVKV